MGIRRAVCPWMNESQRLRAGLTMLQCRRIEESPQGRGRCWWPRRGALLPCDALVYYVSISRPLGKASRVRTPSDQVFKLTLTLDTVPAHAWISPDRHLCR
jgi:hypothetical protein